jgi:hypothetical protein
MNADCTACAEGYTLVGDAAMGPQSCVKSEYITAVGEGVNSRFGTLDDAKKLKVPNLQTGDPHPRAKEDDSAEGTVDLSDVGVMSHLYLNASVRCLYHDGTADADRACQTLANLCVVASYRLVHPACKAFWDDEAGLRRLRGEVHELGGKVHLPWLFYEARARWLGEIGASRRASRSPRRRGIECIDWSYELLLIP